MYDGEDNVFQNGRWYKRIQYGNGKEFLAPLGGSGQSNPNIGINKASKLYNGVGGGSANYNNTQLRLPLRDPATGRFISTNPMMSNVDYGNPLPRLTGQSARQLSLFDAVRPTTRSIPLLTGRSSTGFSLQNTSGYMNSLMNNGLNIGGTPSLYGQVRPTSASAGLGMGGLPINTIQGQGVTPMPGYVQPSFSNQGLSGVFNRLRASAGSVQQPFGLSNPGGYFSNIQSNLRAQAKLDSIQYRPTSASGGLRMGRLPVFSAGPTAGYPAQLPGQTIPMLTSRPIPLLTNNLGPRTIIPSSGVPIPMSGQTLTNGIRPTSASGMNLGRLPINTIQSSGIVTPMGGQTIPMLTSRPIPLLTGGKTASVPGFSEPIALGGKTLTNGIRPTSGFGGTGLNKLPINTIPSSGQVYSSYASSSSVPLLTTSKTRIESVSVRPTSASAGTGMGRLPINTIPSSGKITPMGTFNVASGYEGYSLADSGLGGFSGGSSGGGGKPPTLGGYSIFNDGPPPEPPKTNFFSKGTLAKGLKYLGNIGYIAGIAGRDAQDVNDIGSIAAVAGSGRFFAGVANWAGKKIVNSGAFGYARDAKGFSILTKTGERAVPLKLPGYMSILSGITAGYDLSKTLGADPYRANSSGIDAVVSSAFFGSTFGAPGAFIGAGVGLLGSGLLNKEGYEGSLRVAQYYDAQTEREYRELISPLGAGSSRLLTQKYNKELSLGQKLARPISTFLDSIYGAAGSVVEAPRQIFGVPTRQSVSADFDLLLSAGGKQGGIFKGVGLENTARILGNEITSGSKTDPGLKSFTDAAFSSRGGLSGAFTTIETVLEKGVDDRLKNTDLSFKQARVLDNAGSYQISQGLAFAATDYERKLTRDIIKQQTQASTPLVAPSKPRDIASYNWRTGTKTTYKKTETLGDVIAGGPIGSFFNNVIGNPLKRLFSSGSINKLKADRESAVELKRLHQLRANEKITAVAKSNPSLAKKLLGIGGSSGRTVTSSGGGGGGGRRGGGYGAYAADRLFSSSARMSEARFERDMAMVVRPDYSDIKFDWSGMHAENAMLQPGQIDAEHLYPTLAASYDTRVSSFGAEVGAATENQNKFVSSLLASAHKAAGALPRAGSPIQSYDRQTSAYRMETDALKTAQTSNTQITKLNAQLADLTKATTRANTLQQEANKFEKRNLEFSERESRYLRQNGLQAGIQAERDFRYQLNQDRQLGLVSKVRFVREDAASSLAEVKKERSYFELTSLEKDAEVKASASVHRKEGREDAAVKLEQSYAQWKTDQLDSITRKEIEYGSEKTEQKVRILKAQELTEAISPFTDALFDSAVFGKKGGFGKASANAAKGLLGSSVAGLIGNIPGVGNILSPALRGDMTELSKSLAEKFATGPYSNAFGTPAKAQKSIGYGMIGYTASQYVANAVSPYQNQTVGSLGSLAGGLMGAKFGPAGTGIGSFVGGMLGALPITQTPLGGAVSGAFSGFMAGNALFPGVGGLVGGLIGGIAGLFGGKASKAKKQAAYNARVDELRQKRQVGRELALNYAQGGIAYASDLFSGYGDYNDRSSALTKYLTPESFEKKVGSFDNVYDKETLSHAKGKFAEFRQEFAPIQRIADQYRGVLARPGGMQGQLSDISMADQMRSNRGGAFASGPLGDLFQSFSSIRSSLGQYGFDQQRANLASQFFQQGYNTQMEGLNYNINIADRAFQHVIGSNQVSGLERGINRDVLTRQLTNYDRDSRIQVEQAMGTLQRRENRQATVTRLREEQAFEKDILTRKYDVFEKSSALSVKAESYNQQDALKTLEDLSRSRTILQEGFSELAPRLVDASEDFYKMSEAIKEVNRQLELLSRNLS